MHEIFRWMQLYVTPATFCYILLHSARSSELRSSAALRSLMSSASCIHRNRPGHLSSALDVNANVLRILADQRGASGYNVGAAASCHKCIAGRQKSSQTWRLAQWGARCRYAQDWHDLMGGLADLKHYPPSERKMITLASGARKTRPLTVKYET
jgi:hypothetical protein